MSRDVRTTSLAIRCGSAAVDRSAPQDTRRSGAVMGSTPAERSDAADAPTLAAAWAAAEDALAAIGPDRWELRTGHAFGWEEDADPYWADAWHLDMPTTHGIIARGPSLVAALCALAHLIGQAES